LLPGSGRLAATANHLAGRVVPALARSVRWKPASFRRVAAEHQVELPARTLDALDADLNLIASVFPVLEERPLAAGELAVGPVYAKPEGELPAAVRALAERRRPAVYVGLGSSADRELARSVLDQLAPLDLDVVAGVGRYLTAADRAQLPATVHVHDFLPAHRLTGLIDASIIHGGEGTVQTACASGVPFAGIGLQTEQRMNIAECVRHGNALRLTRSHLRRALLPVAVDHLLHDASLRRTAATLGTRVAALDGAAPAAGAIGDLLDH